MKARNQVTGQFCKPNYVLYLHDLGNLACQIVEVSPSKASLDKLAESMNNVFIKGGNDHKFIAEVYIDESEIE